MRSDGKNGIGGGGEGKWRREEGLTESEDVGCLSATLSPSSSEIKRTTFSTSSVSLRWSRKRRSKMCF